MPYTACQAAQPRSCRCWMEGSGSSLLKRVLGIQYLDPWRACTLFLLLCRLSSEETMSTVNETHSVSHTIWVVTRLASFLAVYFNTLGPSLNGNFRYTSVVLSSTTKVVR